MLNIRIDTDKDVRTVSRLFLLLLPAPNTAGMIGKVHGANMVSIPAKTDNGINSKFKDILPYCIYIDPKDCGCLKLNKPHT
jgi:hypothetical protein